MKRSRLGPGQKSLERGSTFAKPRSRLRRTRWRRRDRPTSTARPQLHLGTPCFFAEVLGWPGPCAGRMDPCHWIPQERIVETFERRGEACPDLWDEALWAPGCRRHHTLFDRKFRQLNRLDYPPTLLAWIQDHRFFWDELKGWVGEATPTVNPRAA